MDKQERKLKGKYKWIKRLKNLSLWNKGNPEPFTRCWRDQGSPCSCYLCSHNKYKRNKKHKKDLELEYLGEFHPDFLNELHDGGE